MKNLLCRLGQHDDLVSRTVEAHGNTQMLVTTDRICKRCKREDISTVVLPASVMHTHYESTCSVCGLRVRH